MNITETAAGWKSIASVPVSVKRILAGFAATREIDPVVLHRCKPVAGMEWCDYRGEVHCPSHWMPVPENPR